MSCLVITPKIRELAKKFPNETEQSILNLVGLWQEKNNKSVEDIPLGSELNDFIKEIRKATPFKWARTAENGYEVSTRGDKRFSALVATFKKGTVIDGVDVGGRTIEDVYQSVIKKSRKGQAPSKESRLYNESLKTKEEREDFSYTEGYLPLWQEWARQNPELIEELREKVKGKVLTDQFANTRVSQARALAEILNSTINNSAPKVSLSTNGYRKGDPQKHPDVNYVFTENAEAYMMSQDTGTADTGTLLPSTWLEALEKFPNKRRTKLNVSDVGGTNQAGIRTDNKGNISHNAYGIVVKKYQQDANGRFVAKEGQFQDTDEDFNLFVSLNEDMFRRLSESSNKKIVFPTQMGLGKAALPKRFAEWLQSQLFERFGISSSLKENTRADYDGYGLSLTSISLRQEKNEISTLNFKPEEAEFYSGAAIGSDKAWEEAATKAGIKVKNYTVTNWDKLSNEERERLDKEYQEVVNILGRKVLDINSYAGKLVRRDMMQADKADAIFAIGKVAYNGYVDGGTGYATTRGIIRGIPVYLFDQSDSTWKVWDKEQSKFIPTIQPSLTKNAAVVGTRKLQDNGKEAINSIFTTIPQQTTQFTLEDFEVKVPDGREVSGGTTGIANGKYVSFHTIEGAFQAAKLNYLDNISYTEEEFKKLTEEGKDGNTILKKLGEARTTQEVTNIVNEVQLDEGLNIELWNKAAPIIRKALEDKYEKKSLAEILNSQSGEVKATTLDETLSNSFDTPRVTSVEEQQKVDLLFDPKTRRDRVTLIARFFSNEVDNALQEMTDSLKRRIDDASGVEKEELQAELNSLDRFSAIKKYTPAGIFLRVANIFNSYVQDTEEGRIQQELNAINSMRGADKFSDEQKLEAAKKKAAYKNQEYRKIVDDPYVYKALTEEASTLLVMTEGIRIDPNYIAPADANLNDDDPDGNSEVDNEAEDWGQEEAYKDGWMTNFRQVSSQESLSQAVRKVIRQVPRLDYRGKYEKDDLGFTRYLDADYVHATLIDKLRNMINSDDMLPLMQDLQRIKPWVKQVTKLLQGDETLFSQFYQDFRKDFTSYWIQRKKMMPDGTFKMETIAINKPEGVYYLLDAWRDNYENGIQLDDDSVYKKNGEINKDNAAKGLQWTETLNNMFQNLDTESRLQLLEREDVWNTIMKLLHMLGIDANPSILRTALTDIKTAPGITFTDPIMLLLPQLNVIFSGIKKGEVKSETREDGTERREDLINTFSSAYSMIASMMAEVTEDAIESSVRENGKSYYSHVTPNYLGKLIKNLKNVMNDKERFEQFMQTEFKDYEWFFKDGHWRNDWLRQLAESDELRRGLNHKVVLNSDKVDYTDWDDLDYTLALLTEYWGDPDSAKSSIKYAWYHVPILSDSPSAEFIRFRKYTTGDVLDENGKKRTYDDVILDKLVDLVNQEYDRIMLVRERDEAYQSGDKNVEPIANYDIVRKKDGSIKSIGGAEFKFLPALNDLRYDNGETFIDRLSRLKSKGTGAELRNFLRTTLNDMMEDGFEQTYRDWMRVGLLDELPNGKYKYLPFEGQSKQNAITAKALTKAKDVLGSLWNTNMELMLRAYNNNSAFDSREANNLMEQIKALLTDKATRGEIELKDAQSISRSLFVKNNAKDALREYYWNSKLATSQIIQLTTTDLAFYKNLEDFQKRYKEVHAPALRLNTKATYKGERIGRDWERTIYLKDDEIVSSVLEDIKTVLDERVRRNEMTKIDRDYIISKFRKVNVADAQAYRSLSSYRAILGMSGQWTDDMEQAYNNFKSGNWNIKDFNIIWQTKKPYVYTQVNNNSGIEGHTGIKTPVQHKNSEFLLLAMHELIAGPLERSGKLKAINKFMEDNQIDVVQFESTTKVGKV